eukprot:scaffold9076_cov68-Phaeocystis_antarctica.AAC.6
MPATCHLDRASHCEARTRQAECCGTVRYSPSAWPRCRASTISRRQLSSSFRWAKCTAAAMTVLNFEWSSSSAGLEGSARARGGRALEGAARRKCGLRGHRRTVQKHPDAFEMPAALVSTGQYERWRLGEPSRRHVRIDPHGQQRLDGSQRALAAHVAKEELELFDGRRLFRAEPLVPLHEQLHALRLVNADVACVQQHRETRPRWVAAIVRTV